MVFFLVAETLNTFCYVMSWEAMASEYRSPYFQGSSCGLRCGEFSGQELWRKCLRQFSSSYATERQPGIRNQSTNCRPLEPNRRAVRIRVYPYRPPSQVETYSIDKTPVTTR